MEYTPTPHNEAKKGEIAKTVIMPGDPLRAKLIAEKYLENVTCVNQVRNMFAYTGTYKGKEITVMASGMGIPSMGIYSYELYNYYDVEKIIRIGSAGALKENIVLGDIVIAMGVSTDSNYAHQYHIPGTFAPIADYETLTKVVNCAKQFDIKTHIGNVLSSDLFYRKNMEANDIWRSMGILAIEMESAALYMNASLAGKKALCILTISDHIYRKESMSAEERQNSFIKMIELALNSCIE